MCAIASTSGTMPGSLVTSMCWICALRNFFFAERAADFAFMGFLLAIGNSPLVLVNQIVQRKKPPRHATVSLGHATIAQRSVRDPPLRAGVALSGRELFIDN